ncbi:hypothetical protein ACFQ3R_02245 [Mesonia ostreae]|uniref:Calx-beta domain-containing protein n=1 Tax=Mesonia ostreae TaxID=861110 RepID=A0ABU2KLD8_9FLAO|nr:hypothetical protein [Mesonia ostreae]MDT0295531.1 hypothetical protein [Mesonia ostreae]
MKINKYLIIGFSLFTGLIFTSCNDDEYDFPDSSEKPLVSLSSENTVNLAEGDTAYFSFNVEYAINKPIMFSVVTEEGSADPFIDFTIGDGALPADNGNSANSFLVTVPANVTSFEVPVYGNQDLSVSEGAENVELSFTITGTRTAIVKNETINLTVNFEDEITDEFIAILDWDANYMDEDGETNSFCDFDLDLEIYPAAGGDPVATSYSACPESISINDGDLPDGDYEIKASYYTSSGTALPVDFESIPAVVTLAKRGMFNEIVDLTGIWTDFEAGLDPNADGVIDNPEYYETVANLNISGTTYTVTNPTNGDVIFQGRAQ